MRILVLLMVRIGLWKQRQGEVWMLFYRGMEFVVCKMFRDTPFDCFRKFESRLQARQLQLVKYQ